MKFAAFLLTVLPRPAGYTEATLPARWKAMLMKVEPERGLPHFREVQIKNAKAKAVSAERQPYSLLKKVLLRDITIPETAAGKVDQAKDWSFQCVGINTHNKEPVAALSSSSSRLELL